MSLLYVDETGKLVPVYYGLEQRYDGYTRFMVCDRADAIERGRRLAERRKITVWVWEHRQGEWSGSRVIAVYGPEGS